MIIYTSFIYSTCKLEATQMSFANLNRVWYISGILLSYEKEWTTDMCNSLDGFLGY